VISTTELLENILMFLPMKDLLLAQRVSRNWKAVITKSISLQQRLFFVPRKADFCWELEVRSEYPQMKWPKQVDREHKLPETLPDGIERMTLVNHGQMNPLIFRTAGDINMWDYAYDEGGTILQPMPDLQHPSAQYPKASWRGMLISQPPTKTCDWDGCFGFPWSEEGRFRGSLTSEGYITCADLYREVGERFHTGVGFMGIWGMPTIYPQQNQLAEMLAEQGVLGPRRSVE
jgi:hypothetical protein